MLGAILAKNLLDLMLLEMEPLDLVIEHATFDRRPRHDPGRAAVGRAHIFLFENFREPRPILAVLEKLLPAQIHPAYLIDLLDQPGLDRIRQRHPIMAPTPFALGGFPAKSVEKRIAPVMGRPDRQIKSPGDPPGSRAPKRFRIGMGSEFVEADA